MNLVFVGAGMVFGLYAPTFMRAARAEYPNAKFFVVEPDDTTFAQLPSELFTRVDLAEAARIAGLAVIMTPSHVRWQVCEPFVARRVPIVVEKPLTIRWAEIPLFEQAAKDSFVCPVLNVRHLEQVESLVSDIPKPTFVSAWKFRHRWPAYYSGWHGKYATDGGVLAQQGFHCLDLVCWLGGNPTAVRAKGERRMHDIECEDTCRAEVEFPTCRGEVYCTTAQPSGADQQAGLLIRSEFGEGQTTGPGFVETGRGGHSILADRVMAALVDGGSSPTTVESALPAVRALHACYVSMDREGAEVRVGQEHPRLGRD